MIPQILIDHDIKNWLEEDIPLWDVSSQIISDKETSARIIAKQDGVICGLEVIKRIFNVFNVQLQTEYFDGYEVKKGDEVCNLTGSSKGILQAERTALNILSHMSGVASLTKKFVKLIHNPKIRIAATRKTLPGLRRYEKWAIQCGGGDTHRTSLSDMVMFKENHIASLGGITNAVEKVRKQISFTTKIEVEVRNFEEVVEAAKSKVDIIMLDNFSLDKLEAAITEIRKLSPSSLIEVSGNISEKTLSSYSKYDIDIISSGKLTHSVKSFDLSLLFDSVEN